MEVWGVEVRGEDVKRNLVVETELWKRRIEGRKRQGRWWVSRLSKVGEGYKGSSASVLWRRGRRGAWGGSCTSRLGSTLEGGEGEGEGGEKEGEMPLARTKA